MNPSLPPDYDPEVDEHGAADLVLLCLFGDLVVLFLGRPMARSING